MAQQTDTVLRLMGGHITVQWEIPNFLDRTIESGKYIMSPEFVLSGVNWHLQIFPKGVGEMSSDWISLFLWRSPDSGDHFVSYSFRIKESGSITKVFKAENNFNDKSRYKGCYFFVKRSVLDNFLHQDSASNGALTIICTVRLLDGRQQETASQTSQPESLPTLSNNLGGLFLGGNQTDVKIKVEEQEFDAHKLIWKSRSPVFSEMLEHNMVDSIDGVIIIPDMETEHVKDLLLYIYTGKSHIVTAKNALELYKAADKYSLDELKEECKLRLLTELSVDSVLDVIQLAVVHDETEILKNGTNFFMKNAEDIISTEKWELFYSLNTPLASELVVDTVKNLKPKVIPRLMLQKI